jgi:hypothetical protein
MEAKCAECGVTVVITDIRLNGHSFVMKPGESLAQLCPVIIERAETKKDISEEIECPHLNKSIEKRIEQFRRDHP